MLNSLEKLPTHSFFRFQGILPSSIGLRFHGGAPADVAAQHAENGDSFLDTYLSLAKEHQGVYRCEVAKLAFELNISPFTIPKILYNLQEQGKQEISYEVD